ncbi:hypothetical protein F511_20980 [Dorcoceras hygrometricum]|uniref:Uncharacterized protein n=1 Tax=Dorcoceras hygrometricum TaxID=472368 RepID=A0A2Z7CKZ1_9LAMI|nr:hypothetical protein F511_20980 [Dorcoceras hygrometricum]
MRIAEKLVNLTEPKDLELINDYGSTSLSLAAISGAEKLAKAIVSKNEHLLRMANEHEDGRLLVAAQYGMKHIIHYFYEVTPKDKPSPEKGENGAMLHNCLITAEIYDVASILLKRYPRLVFIPDHNGNHTLKILALHSLVEQSFEYRRNGLFLERVHSPWEDERVSQLRRWSTLNDHCNDICESSDDEVNDSIKRTKNENSSSPSRRKSHVFFPPLVESFSLRSPGVILQDFTLGFYGFSSSPNRFRVLRLSAMSSSEQCVALSTINVSFASMCLKKLSGFVLILGTSYHDFSAGRGVDPAGGALGGG